VYLFKQLQNIANEGLGYGNDKIITLAEQDLVNRVKGMLPEHSIVFDVGANEGNYLASWIGYKNVQLHAFEPGKDAFQTLKSRFGKYATLNLKAVGSSNALLSFYAEKTDSRMNSLLSRTHAKHIWEETEKVECITLNTYCQEKDIHHIDFLKIDVEGYELEVLKGASDLLSSINWIQFEFGGAHLENKVTFRDFYTLLSGQFKLYHLLRDGQEEIDIYHEKLENYTGANFLAVRKDTI